MGVTGCYIAGAVPGLSTLPAFGASGMPQGADPTWRRTAAT